MVPEGKQRVQKSANFMPEGAILKTKCNKYYLIFVVNMKFS